MLRLARFKGSGAAAGIEPNNSVFPVGEGGVFEQVCGIWDRKTPDELNDGQWRWYAVPISDREFHALVVPQPPALPEFQVRHFSIASLLPGSGHMLALVIYGTPGENLQTLCKYSPDSNRWTRLPPMNTPRDLLSFAGATIGDSFYVAGGQRVDGWRKPVAAAERFDLQTDRWEALPSMNVGRSFPKGFALDGRFFVVQNSVVRCPMHRSAEIFDPSTNEWTLVPQFLPPNAERFSVAILRNELYMVKWSTLAPSGTLLRYNKSSGSHEWVFIDEVPCKDDSYSAHRQLFAVGSELWVIDHRGPESPALGSDNTLCGIMHRMDQVSCGTSIWPTFPGPSYWPNEGEETNPAAQSVIYACKIDDKNCGVSPLWRTIPVFGLLRG